MEVIPKVLFLDVEKKYNYRIDFNVNKCIKK